MNEDLEQSRAPFHAYTHRRLRDMINRNHRRMEMSASYITQNYNRFFNTSLTPNNFLNSINQEMVDELANRQIDPALENERRRLLVEIDRYRKIKAIIREVKAVLMIVRYNRLSKERRRRLNIEHLSETGMTYIEDIDRTMPIYPFYFRGLRTRIPQNADEPVTFVSTYYDQYRLLGSNKVTLGGLLPETFVNPVLIGTRRRTDAFEDERSSYYDLDDLRPTGREREDSVREAEEANNKLRNGNNVNRDTTGLTHPQQQNPTPPAPDKTPEVPETTPENPWVEKEDPEAQLQSVRDLANNMREYENVQSLSTDGVKEVNQLLQRYDELHQNNYGLVLDALGRDYEHIQEVAAHLRTLLSNYDKGYIPPGNTDGNQNTDTTEELDKPTTVEELQKVAPDADADIVRRVADLGRTIMRTRYRESPNTVDLIEGLLAEYDQLRLNPETAEVVRSMLRINPKIGKKIDNFRLRIADLDFRTRMQQAEITDFEPNPVNDTERLKEMINNFPDPSLVIFNRDIDAFHRMADIVELYHVVRPSIRFKESPIMKISDEGRLTRSELMKLKRILQTYREIYENEILRDAFLGNKRTR